MLKLSYRPTRMRPEKISAKNRLEVGCKYKIKVASSKGYNDCYPFGGGSVPVFVLNEYARFYVVVVLEHLNANTIFGESKQYNVTIDKFDLETGIIKIVK